MKVHYKKILYVGIVICLLISGVIAETLYSTKVDSWSQQASAVFKQALELELQKRDTVFVFYKESVGYSNLSLNKLPSDTIKLIGESGEREFVMSKEKYDNSLVKETLKRSILSILLEDYPLIPDTLNGIWDSLLVASDVSVNAYTRISVTDFLDNTSVAYSKGVLESLPADSLVSYYLGERCEVEATGFVSYNWWRVLGAQEYFFLCLPWIILILLYVFVKKLVFRLVKGFRQHEPIVIEEDVPVIAVKPEKSYIYQLEEGVFFDTKCKVLRNAGKVTKLAPQVASLLKLFLESEECRLSTSEIDRALWLDSSGTQDRIHSVIRRLRRSLDGMTHFYIDYENDVYQLKNTAPEEKVKGIM